MFTPSVWAVRKGGRGLHFNQQKKKIAQEEEKGDCVIAARWR